MTSLAMSRGHHATAGGQPTYHHENTGVVKLQRRDTTQTVRGQDSQSYEGEDNDGDGDGDGDGDEEEDADYEEDEEEAREMLNELTIKAGYLWKKGEKRKVRALIPRNADSATF